MHKYRVTITFEIETENTDEDDILQTVIEGIADGSYDDEIAIEQIS